MLPRPRRVHITRTIPGWPFVDYSISGRIYSRIVCWHLFTYSGPFHTGRVHGRLHNV